MYTVTLAPGCYTSIDAPVVSRHRTWEAALNAASRSDRLVAEGPRRSAGIPPQGDPRLGRGRYGAGLTGRERTAWVRDNL